MKKKKPLYKKFFRTLEGIVTARPIRRYIAKQKHKAEYKNLIANGKISPDIYFDFNPGWYIFEKMQQRAPHIAREFAKCGYTYFYKEIGKSVEARENNCPIKGVREIEKDLYLTDFDIELFENSEQTIIQLWSPNLDLKKKDFYKKHLERGGVILYEYIDAISPMLHLEGISQEYLDFHNFLLKNIKVIVVASADMLYEEAIKARGNQLNICLATNGVNLDDFKIEKKKKDIPAELQKHIKEKKKIIGYYGSLASWVDYELIRFCATRLPSHIFVLIGRDCDNSILASGVEKHENIIVLNNIEYKELIKASVWFDIAIIPFKINEVTVVTSPLKIFEYMAASHPIVITDLPECRKYKSALIAKSYDDFVSLIEKGISLKEDNNYLALLAKEAQENSWKKKVEIISQAIKDYPFALQKSNLKQVNEIIENQNKNSNNQLVFAHNVFNRFEELEKTLQKEISCFEKAHIVVGYNHPEIQSHVMENTIRLNDDLFFYKGASHQIGCTNAFINCVRKASEIEKLEAMIFTHDDVRIVDENKVKENLALIQNGTYDVIARRPLGEFGFGENYLMIEAIFLSSRAIKLIAQEEAYSSEEQLPLDMNGNISTEVVVYNLVRKYNLKLKIIEYAPRGLGIENMYAYNADFEKQLGFHHINYGLTGWQNHFLKK